MDINDEYNSIIDEYKDFLKEVKNIIEKTLNKNNIPIAFNVSFRIKSLDSIHEKVASERISLKESITELNDLIGIRIVLLFPEYKNKVVELLSKDFKLLNDPSKSEQSPDKFGYSSVHLILGVKEDWILTPNWENHAEKKVEVQIRTLSEHIWAETSHALFYKKEENIPNIINRDLYKLSAILEVVDDKLQDLKIKIEKHFDYIKTAPFEEILKMDLNSETFRRVMVENSKQLYKLNDYRNKILSSKVEKEYNILNVNILNDLIQNKIDQESMSESDFIKNVIQILDTEKLRIDENQKKDN